AARSRSGIRSSQSIPLVPPVPPGSIRSQDGIPSRGSYPITSLSGAIVPPTCREVKCFLGAVFPPEAGAGLRHNRDARTPSRDRPVHGLLYANKPPDAFRSPRRGRDPIEAYMSWCPIILA